MVVRSDLTAGEPDFGGGEFYGRVGDLPRVPHAERSAPRPSINQFAQPDDPHFTITDAMSSRTTASGRPMVSNFYKASYLDPVGRHTPEGIEYRLEQVNATAVEMKFEGILDAALALLESGTVAAKSQLIKFAQEGKFDRFLDAAAGRRTGRIKSEEIDSAICRTARTVYLEDWDALTDSRKYHRLRMPMKSLKAEDIQNFCINTMYAEMRSHAPRIFALFEGMGNESNGGDDNDKKLRRQRRYITMVIYVLGNLRSQKINYLQAIMTYFLYSNRVPKRVLNIMHNWGVAVGYTSVLDAVKSIGTSRSVKAGG